MVDKAHFSERLFSLYTRVVMALFEKLSVRSKWAKWAMHKEVEKSTKLKTVEQIRADVEERFGRLSRSNQDLATYLYNSRTHVAVTGGESNSQGSSSGSEQPSNSL